MLFAQVIKWQKKALTDLRRCDYLNYCSQDLKVGSFFFFGSFLATITFLSVTLRGCRHSAPGNAAMPTPIMCPASLQNSRVPQEDAADSQPETNTSAAWMLNERCSCRDRALQREVDRDKGRGITNRIWKFHLLQSASHSQATVAVGSC